MNHCEPRRPSLRARGLISSEPSKDDLLGASRALRPTPSTMHRTEPSAPPPADA